MSGLLELFANTTVLAQHAGHDFSSVTTEHHAQATGGPLEAVLVGAGVLIVAVVLVLTIKFYLRPGEPSPEHIKRRILGDEYQ